MYVAEIVEQCYYTVWSSDLPLTSTLFYNFQLFEIIKLQTPVPHPDSLQQKFQEWGSGICVSASAPGDCDTH